MTWACLLAVIVAFLLLVWELACLWDDRARNRRNAIERRRPRSGVSRREGRRQLQAIETIILTAPTNPED